MSTPLNTQLRKGTLEMCVLAVLSRANSYTYEIVQQLSRYMAISEGTIYPLMRRLQDEGWLETYLQESQAGPARKYYRLTAFGQTALHEMREQWADFVAEITGILADESIKGETK